MTEDARMRSRLARREVLLAAVAGGVGLGAEAAGIRPAAGAAQTTVTFDGWAFEPQVVEALLKRFMAENPDLRVKYTPLDLQLYAQKMIALLNAGDQSDAFYVRDIDLGAWVEAGWLQPIDGMPGLADLDKDTYPFNLEALYYKGKQYGTPYYGDIFVYMYDKNALAKAAVAKPPVTLDELKNAALEVRKAGIADYPILKGYKIDVDGLDELWSMVFASGGHLFTPTFDPVYPQEDKTALMVLEWMVEAMHSWHILDPRGLQLDQTQARDAYLSGQGVFTSNVGNVLPRANMAAYSKRAGRIAMTRFPGLTDTGHGPMGWTRLYGLSPKTKVRAAAERLLYYIGGKDSTGHYYTAKEWYLRYGVGYAFKSLDNDPDIIRAQRGWGYDLALRSQQYGSARARENVTATWYSEWDRFTQQQVQQALLRQITPQQALTASANKAQALKKNS